MDIFTAKYGRKCPCGTEIKKGDSYCDDGETEMCMKCGFPEKERNLVLINRSVKK